MFVIYGQPIGKPRQTRSDRWKIRPCVARYRVWADLARLVCFGTPHKKLTLTKPTALRVRAWIDSGTTHRTGPHTVTIDLDNCIKAVCDALFQNDQMIYAIDAKKLWCDGGKPRVEVEWWS